MNEENKEVKNNPEEIKQVELSPSDTSVIKTEEDELESEFDDVFTVIFEGD